MSDAEAESAARVPAPAPDRFEHLSRWIALGANVGVLAGLILVILQLNQNERMIRAQTRHEMAHGISTLLIESAADEHLNQALYRGNHGEPLSPEDANAYYTYRNALMRYWEDVHYQYRMGLYDEAEFDRQRLAWKASMTSSALAIGYWCGVQGLYSAEFAREMNGLIGPDACASTSQAVKSHK